MELFTVLSKKEQVAEAIRNKIISGNIPPGTRLGKVRELAGMFSVSTKIIIDAFDILEAEKLISRNSGRGVFVRRSHSKDTMEVCLLGYMSSTRGDTYFLNLSRIAYPPFLHKNFSFITRTIPFVAVHDDNHLDHELKKLEQHLHVDCFLINAPPLNKRQIKMCLQLKTPVIFIGDFVGGLYPEVPFNQITGDNYWAGASSVQQLVDRQACKELTLYSGSMDHYFYRRFYEGVLQTGEKLGVKIHLIEIPKGTSSLPEAKRNKCYLGKISSAIDKGYLECPGINAGTDNDTLQTAFAACGKNPDIYHGEFCGKSFEKFFDVIYDRIKVVVAEPDNYKKFRLKTDVELQLLSK
jgi:Bacterial regulatory proteins, gntR family